MLIPFNDRLFGDDGIDVLTGADASVGRGVGEVDRLTGGTGSDRFVLGTTVSSTAMAISALLDWVTMP